MEVGSCGLIFVLWRCANFDWTPDAFIAGKKSAIRRADFDDDEEFAAMKASEEAMPKYGPLDSHLDCF
jgi:hypothetical protein